MSTLAEHMHVMLRMYSPEEYDERDWKCEASQSKAAIDGLEGIFDPGL